MDLELFSKLFTLVLAVLILLELLLRSSYLQKTKEKRIACGPTLYNAVTLGGFLGWSIVTRPFLSEWLYHLLIFGLLALWTLVELFSPLQIRDGGIYNGLLRVTWEQTARAEVSGGKLRIKVRGSFLMPNTLAWKIKADQLETVKTVLSEKLSDRFH